METSKRMTKQSLIKRMRSLEKKIKQLEHEFLINEVNDLQTLKIWLESTTVFETVYYDIRQVYKEIIKRYSRPAEEIYPSKIGLDKESLKELEYQWDL